MTRPAPRTARAERLRRRTRLRFLLPALCVACASARPPPPADAPVATVITVGGSTVTPVAATSQAPTDAGATAPPPDDAGATGTTGAAGTAGTGTAEGLYQEGLRAYGRGDLQAAARAFADAYTLRLAPELAFNAGRMYERMAMVPEATRYYGYVLAASTDAAQRTDIEARLAALRDYDRRRREDFAQPPPGDDALAHEAATWFSRGVTLIRRRDYNGALRAFEAAHQYTSSPELLFNLAVTHEHLGHRGDAVDAFRAYLQQRPDSPDRTTVEQRIHTLEAGGR